MATPLREDPLPIERAAARACREYHETVVTSLADLAARRASMAEFAWRFYQERLRITPTPEERASFRALAEPTTVAVEIAHDGQLPHLGVVRMVLKASEVARLDGRGVALYLVGNHYSAEMRPDNIHFGMPLRGNPPGAVKHPPKLPMGKANVHKPFRWLPPPSDVDLGALQAQVADFVGHNLAYERKGGRRIPPEAGETILGRLEHLFAVLRSAASDVKTFGDWIIRIQHDLLVETFGEDIAARIIFLPMAELTEVFRSELDLISRSEGEVGRIKAEISSEQASRREEPYSRRSETASFWCYCPSCGRRLRVPLLDGLTQNFRCPVCGHAEEIPPAETWRWMMPDIVAYQAALFRVGVDGWVAGSRAAYHPVITEVSSRLFGVRAPPAFFLTSRPVFHGLGDAPEGFRKTRLLRALLEMEPRAITESLRGPWDENPQLKSQFLTEQA